ncbi:DUF4276 family protein [Rhodopseudomonas sp. HC1]|uniref:DUF4276 family protein n=1 Tax=Rhodopseudomonas infernalis TaxID=2897386 RepID=UPI001EE7FBAC|nr:DUF4276 family protein [Rhodopseudomonas infernalis]MCG6205398.1 DUF4276 family protein [Rhodopseudomonas infernalis]
MSAAFIVDGLTEKKIIQRLCPGSPIRTTGMNGKDVALKAIAKAANSLIKLFRGRYYPIVIIVDREGRAQSAIDIERDLTRLLVELGAVENELIVCSPDRMIENWMLADTKYLFEIYDVQAPTPCEGLHGKQTLKRLLATKNISYHETTVGVDILSNCDPHAISERAESFQRLMERAQFFCRWLRATP